MKKFLLKGILHDRGRSLVPVFVVAIGALLTVFLYSWVTGAMGDSIEMSSNFNTGDVKVMTRAYAAEADQIPNDLAILGAGRITEQLKNRWPDMDWVARIRFGALADFPDREGLTRGQGPVAGWAIDLISVNTKEPSRFNLPGAIVRGAMPSQSGECLISEELASRFDVNPGESFTLFGTTMEGGFSFTNYIVSGTLKFGSARLDRGAVILDIRDARSAFGMDDAAGEILGYLPVSYYDHKMAVAVQSRFNADIKEFAPDEEKMFEPVMLTLKEQSGMAELVDYSNAISAMLIFIFVAAMAIVLWNAGLLGGLRRYTEFGVRIALGEDKGHIYRSLLWEAVMIGCIGSLAGTAAGVALVYALNVKGFDMSGYMQNATILMPSVIRPAITPVVYYIGFIPGVFSMLLGNALAGAGIYRRETARLFNELEV